MRKVSGTRDVHRSVLEVVPGAGTALLAGPGDLEIAPTVMVRIPDEIDASFEAMRKDEAEGRRRARELVDQDCRRTRRQAPADGSDFPRAPLPKSAV